MMVLIYELIAYLIGLVIAEKLYRYGEYNRDHYIVWWSWIGVFVILLSLSGGRK